MPDTRTACYALTPGGALLARRLAAFLASPEGGEERAHVYVPSPLREGDDLEFESLPVLLGQTFSLYRAHIFVAAAGIAVRCIAPHLTHKSMDPAVVVCDETGKFCVSLLSGHWGGGNALTRSLAAQIGATPVITTATDCHDLPAVDMLAQEAGCTVVDWGQIKVINAALLRGEKVQLRDPLGLLGATGSLEQSGFTSVCMSHVDQGGMPEWDPSRPAVSVDWRQVPASDKLLRLAVPALHVGVGCRRGVGATEIVAAVKEVLTKYGLEPLALAGLASITAKEDEQGLVEAARLLHLPLRFFTPEELSDAPTLTPSAMAAQLFGVEHISVSEGAALLSAGGEEATLLVPKVKYQERVTVALALPEHFLPAREQA